MNKVILIGKIIGQKKYSISKDRNHSIIKFCLSPDNSKTPQYLTVIAFDKIADNFNKYINSNDTVQIEGHLIRNVYENSLGNKTYEIQIISDKITYLSKAKSNEDNNNQQSQQKYIIDNLNHQNKYGFIDID